MSTKTETAVVEIILKGQQANASLKDIEKAARAVRAQLGRLPADSQEFADKTKEFQKINSRLKSIKDDVNGVGGVFGKIGNEIKGFGLLAAGYLGFDWLKSSISGIIKSNAKLSDSLADIRKTTGMTDEEARKLNTSLSQINTRTAASELRNIAIAGGQLGIAKGDILKFTTAVDKMNVALGDEFTGGAEEVTKAMGGLRNTFTDIKSDRVDEDLLHIGNAINALASSGAATGPVISDFANRIGGVGITLGLTSDQVLGLSATLQELQVNQERGGTAVSKILQKMTTNTAEFAKVAGVPIQKFTDMVNKDLYGAFIKVVEGSKKGGASATSFGKILDDLGVDGAGASEVFAKLSNNTGLLSEKVALAGTSLKGTSSIMNEFNIKNQTLGAEMERLSKGLSSAFSNSAITKGLKDIVSSMASLFDKTKKVSESMVDEQHQVNALSIELKSSNTTNERRKEIYEELKAINPDIVAGIDKESISIQALTENVNEYNSAQINRIVIQKKQEEIEKANSDAADKLIAKKKIINDGEDRLAEIQQLKTISSLQYKRILDDENLSTTQKIENIHKLAVATSQSTKSFGEGSIGKEANLVANLTGNYKSLSKAELEYTTASNHSMEVTLEKIKLEKELLKAKKQEIDYTKLSIDDLNRYVKNSKDSMGNYDREEGKRSLEELKRREEAKKNIIIPLDEKTLEELKAAHEKFLLDLDKLEQDHRLAKMSELDREYALLEIKYAELRKQAKGHRNELERIDKLYYDDKFNLAVKYTNKETDLQIQAGKDAIKRKEKLEKEKTTLEASGSASKNLSPIEQFKKETDDINKEWDKRIADAQEHNNTLLQGEEKYTIDIEALQKNRQIALSNLNDEHNKKTLESDKAFNQKRVKLYEQFWSQASQIISAFNTIQNNNDTKQFDKEKKQNDIKKTQFKHLLDAKIITQREYDKRVNKLDAEQDAKALAIKKKAAEREKNAALVNAAINTASAIIQAQNAAPPPYNYALMALAAILGGVQIAAIESQPAAYAKGGLNNSNDPQGMVNGPTYFTNSSSGKDFIAGEKGAEWIAPNWMLQNPATANTIGMLEAIRQRGYASGGFNTAIPKTDSTTSTSKNNVNTSFISNDTALVDAINNLNSILQNGINANLNYDQFNKDLSAINSARSSAQVKN